jgi:hypothetical protein
MTKKRVHSSPSNDGASVVITEWSALQGNRARGPASKCDFVPPILPEMCALIAPGRTSDNVLANADLEFTAGPGLVNKTPFPLRANGETCGLIHPIAFMRDRDQSSPGSEEVN